MFYSCAIHPFTLSIMTFITKGTWRTRCTGEEKFFFLQLSHDYCKSRIYFLAYTYFLRSSSFSFCLISTGKILKQIFICGFINVLFRNLLRCIRRFKRINFYDFFSRSSPWRIKFLSMEIESLWNVFSVTVMAESSRFRFKVAFESGGNFHLQCCQWRLLAIC